MIIYTLFVIFICLVVSIKSLRAFTKLQVTEEPLQLAQAPRAHKLCMQSYAARQMPNNYAKIRADEDYEEALKAYVESLTNIEATNTVSIIKPAANHVPTKLKIAK
ncbi:hypothetical protein J8L98_23170 [Pseudoalteromonas sp. MMG013]|uniref:hypothetical protein n=1 Tax=Pseudoalteromonas sp. MMG013 TaxID=2822687 RepID=UPI001B381E9F|nr:hypothetical protein [Pseudoalteromonas sp. MMG013]MBQ4864588.1 hypothetical protein [Pseudoalteromonas sp. MMG013]